MNITRLLFGTSVAFIVTVSTGCQEQIGTDRSLESAVEKASQTPAKELGQPTRNDDSTSESDRANSGTDGSNLRVDVNDQGVVVEVGDTVDLTVGKEEVDVDVRPNGEPKGNGTSESPSR